MKDYVPLLQTGAWIVFALIVALIFRRPLVGRLRDGSSLKFGVFELGEKIDRVNDRVVRVLLLTMTDTMYSNLKKLATDRFGEYEKNGGLEREIRHLRDLGYVTVEVGGFNSVANIPDAGPDLSKYVHVLAQGRAYIDLRETVMREDPRATA